MAPFRPQRSPYLIDVTLVQYDASYRRRQVQRTQHMMDVRPVGDEGLTPQTVVARGDTGHYHLALQWTQHAAGIDEALGQVVGRGSHLRMNSWRADALQGLRADPALLEMSDLKPLMLPGAVPPAPEVADSAGVPYPYARLHADTQLVLYFEVYHLAYGADDRTHYTVTYEVERVEKGSSILRIFRPQEDPERTAATTSVTAAGRCVSSSCWISKTCRTRRQRRYACELPMRRPDSRSNDRSLLICSLKSTFLGLTRGAAPSWFFRHEQAGRAAGQGYFF